MAKKKPTQREDRNECATSFEESLDALEAIVSDLETGKLGLSDALSRYEQGVRHLKACQQLLERAERKIEVLSGMDADGNPITSPYADRETESLEEKAASRARRRTSGSKASADPSPPSEGDVDDLGRLF